MSEITVYIKTLSGDIVPISFEPNPKEKNINLIFNVQSFFPEYPVERILLYHNDFIDLSNVKDGDIICLFICDPYEDNWSSLSFSYANYTTYVVNWYPSSTSVNYFYNKEKKSSIYLYIDSYNDVDDDNDDNIDNSFRAYVRKDMYLLEWFSNLKDALLSFQKEYNSRVKHSLFSDDNLIHAYHLWNLNTSKIYKRKLKLL